MKKCYYLTSPSRTSVDNVLNFSPHCGLPRRGQEKANKATRNSLFPAGDYFFVSYNKPFWAKLVQPDSLDISLVLTFVFMDLDA